MKIKQPFSLTRSISISTELLEANMLNILWKRVIMFVNQQKHAGDVENFEVIFDKFDVDKIYV